MHVHARSVATVLRVGGEIDASNAELVARAVRRFSRLRAPLILDLSQLDFLSSAAFGELLILADEHRQAGLPCSVVGGPALRRLAQMVPDHGLPVAYSVPDALRDVELAIRARRQLVSGSARQEEPQRAATASR